MTSSHAAPPCRTPHTPSLGMERLQVAPCLKSQVPSFLPETIQIGVTIAVGNWQCSAVRGGASSVRHRRCLRRGARRSWPPGNVLYPSPVDSNVLASVSILDRESTSSPYATAFACAVVHEDRGHRGTFCTLLPLAATSWLVCRYSTRGSTSLRTPPHSPAPWCTKIVATGERSVHLCRWQQRPGLLHCESWVDGVLRSPLPLPEP